MSTEQSQIVHLSALQAKPDALFPVDERLAVADSFSLRTNKRTFSIPDDNATGISKLLILGNDLALAENAQKDLYVIPDTEHISTFVKIRDKGGRTPAIADLSIGRAAGAGALTGFFGGCAYVIVDASGNNSLGTLMSFGNSLATLIFGTMAGIPSAAAGALAFSTVGIGLKLIGMGSGTIKSQTQSSRHDKAVLNIANSPTTVKVLECRYISSRFKSAIGTMLISDHSPREFWDNHAGPAVHAIAAYDTQIDQVLSDRDNGITSKNNSDDEHILRFRGQVILHSLFDTFNTRKNESAKKARPKEIL